MNNQGTMRIGEVHAILRRDVPDIELSKIRYYEDKGLVQPTRSRKGYRLYSPRDVECLREAIRLAHEEFVPLRVVRLRLIEQGLLDDVPVAAGSRQVARSTSSVISVPVPVNDSPEVANVNVEELRVRDASEGDARSQLTTESIGEEPVIHVSPESVAPPVTVPSPQSVTETVEVVNGPGATPAPPAPRAPVAIVHERDEWDDEERFYSAAEFLTVSGLDAHVMNQLVASGLLSPETVANQSTFNELDLRVARAVKALLARNIDIRLLGSLRRNVEREIGLLNDVIQPVRSSKKSVSARETRDHARSVAVEIAALRAELFARALHRYLGR